jgi:hypothetical protein
VGLLVAGSTGGAQTPIASDPMPHLADAGQLLLLRRSLRLVCRLAST